jgi:hypothetical protein
MIGGVAGGGPGQAPDLVGWLPVLTGVAAGAAVGALGSARALAGARTGRRPEQGEGTAHRP